MSRYVSPGGNRKGPKDWMTVYSLFFNGTLKGKSAVMLHQGLKYHLGLLQVEGHSLVVSSSDDE